jgi:hypothetical protein
MSACIVALVVFAILGIFSAKYRRWAREAFDCVGRRLTLRPCQTGFNDKVRAKVVSKLLARSPKLARFTHRHFEAISWVFTIMMFASLAYSGYSLYNLAVYGTCDPSDPGSCIFTVPASVSAVGPCVEGNGHDCLPCTCAADGVTCEAPDNVACEGNCTCVNGMCRS